MGIFDKIKNNNKKTKTTKFLLLRKLIKMFQLGNKNVNSIIENITVYSPSLKEDSEISRFNNSLKSDLENMDKYWKEIIRVVEKEASNYTNEEFGKDLANFCLKPLQENNISLLAFLRNYDLLIKKLEIKKQILENIEKDLFQLEKKDLIYFEEKEKN